MGVRELTTIMGMVPVLMSIPKRWRTTKPSPAGKPRSRRIRSGTSLRRADIPRQIAKQGKELAQESNCANLECRILGLARRAEYHYGMEHCTIRRDDRFGKS